VDREGLVVEHLPDDARLVYVTPAHQYPLGMPMSFSRRVALIDWSRRHTAAIIEDDYDSEFRFGGRPVEPLRMLDVDGLVIYVGSFSKTLLPVLRLGWRQHPSAARCRTPSTSPVGTPRLSCRPRWRDSLKRAAWRATFDASKLRIDAATT
jgi:GntR family transcriptional regulator / MocR family aminotransferase